ncbi:hypothetical protein [Pseudohongiella spirulinae]|uniref:Uncharacterized protein n=1 Tax=Pseudohongiella spirulinae TaxID=1249552 RepID=A0A0S2KA81_9GAMM|nr:hypothetical protein [Pseudohongiella spirulinae]ALO45293.1 hypothetical protein PS2015_610 [Pseudohongiella spirulinae]
MKTDQPNSSHSLFSVFFWGSIYTMIAITLGLLLLSVWQSQKPTPAGGETIQFGAAVVVSPEPPAEIESGTLRRYFRQANQQAFQASAAALDQLLIELYAPVYAGISDYADFHYSIRGEYTELASAAIGQIGDSMQQIMFAGFDERLNRTSAILDSTYASVFQTALTEAIQNELPEGLQLESLGSITRTAIDSATSRAQVTVPVATATASVGGFAMAKILSKKVATKVAAKAALKGGTSVLGGTGAGAAAGAVFGPVGSAVGAVIGGVSAWLAADAVIIGIDEHFNRDEFESQLSDLVDENKAQLQAHLLTSLAAKQVDMDTFTLQELNESLP